jgi:hypothetical protein
MKTEKEMVFPEKLIKKRNKCVCDSEREDPKKENMSCSF